MLTSQARYVALNPIETSHGHAALNIELTGCHYADVDLNPFVTPINNNIEVSGAFI